MSLSQIGLAWVLLDLPKLTHASSQVKWSVIASDLKNLSVHLYVVSSNSSATSDANKLRRGSKYFCTFSAGHSELWLARISECQSWQGIKAMA